MRDVLLRLRQLQDSMTGTEHEIAGFILENPAQAATMTVRELAKATWSSPSSVFRMCKNAGFSNFREFHYCLVQETTNFHQMDTLEQQTICPEDSPCQIIDKLTSNAVKALEDSRQLLDEQVFLNSVRILLSAHTILLFGIGASLCVARDAYLKFLRLNKPCILNDDWHSQLLQARNSSACDAAIVFSYSGQTEEVLTCMEELKKNGTPIIAITRHFPSAIARQADYCLYIAMEENLFRSAAMTSRLCQLNLVDALFTAMELAEHDSNLRQFVKTHISKPGEIKDDTITGPPHNYLLENEIKEPV